MAYRPIGRQNEKRSRKCEERKPAKNEIDPGTQEARRFSSRYQVRPPM